MHRKLPLKAFTLVELLVVIGIISVLVAILMPALQRARAAAKSVGCQANLHSIMQATFEYANDCNGYLVPANWYDFATPGPYGGPGSGWWECTPSDAILLGKYTDGPTCTNGFGQIYSGHSIWICPEKDWSPGNDATCYSMDQDGQAGPYANETCPVITPLSSQGLGGTPNSPTETGWEYDYKLSSIRSPSRMLAFVCSTNERFEPGGWFFGDPGGINPGGSPTWYYTVTTSYYSLAIRHPGNTTNVSFMDGHVESLTNTPQTIGIYKGLGLYSAFERGDFVVSPNAQ
jgi:prepilin-type processing-associated H-X9-DG protein/prepilin-type N-terminal cleavage/methylation domain-containing protein